MNDLLKEALWEAIESKNDLLIEAKEYAQDGDYAKAADCESRAQGFRDALFTILNNIGERPPKMVDALHKWGV